MASIGIVNAALLLGALLVLVGVLSSLIASRFGAPLLLVFLFVGMLAGEDGPGGLQFSDYQTTYLIGSLALAVILFDGGLRTKLASFRGTLAPAAVLATLGVFITAGLTGFVAYLLLDLSWIGALLLGAIVASTDAAAVFFLLRTGGMKLKRRVGTVLEIESGTNDPVAVFLTVLLVELLLQGPRDLGWTVMVSLGEQAILGSLIGLAGGFLASTLLNRVELPSGLHPVFVVASAVLVYGVAAVLDGSGFLAVYLAGLVLGNRPLRAYPSVISFHDTATWLCQIVMFLMLGLLVSPAKLLDFALPALLLAAFLILVGRPLAVWLCLLPFGFSRRERTFISWVGLRGAVSIFLAAIPMLSGIPQAEIYFNVAFFVVLVSLMVQGWTVTFAARQLGMVLPQAGEPAKRVELDLPGQLSHEMVGYPIPADSLALRLGGLPKWVRPVLLIRDEQLLDPGAAAPLRPHDYVYVLSEPQHLGRLDRLFGSAGDLALPAENEFILNGSAPMQAVSALYGITLHEAEASLSLAATVARRLGGAAHIGDRIRFGDATLTVRDTEAGQVTRAGLRLGETNAGAETIEAVLRAEPDLFDRLSTRSKTAWQALLARLRRRDGNGSA
ncbi:potassium/proton antiporter [Ferrovibrio sp.]|uniref:potassium/proton antiporter n=1 Tax=Ferrovibrio sp. TaxID=1917215 RepID=UPI0025C54F5A|nr:potassium/proton antiporter [Ferrovibrio sp.]